MATQASLFAYREIDSDALELSCYSCHFGIGKFSREPNPKDQTASVRVSNNFYQVPHCGHTFHLICYAQTKIETQKVADCASCLTAFTQKPVNPFSLLSLGAYWNDLTVVTFCLDKMKTAHGHNEESFRAACEKARNMCSIQVLEALSHYEMARVSQSASKRQKGGRKLNLSSIPEEGDEV